MKTYNGNRARRGTAVAVLDSLAPNHIRIMDPRQSVKLFNHSPTGFEWGYSGSGPAQLALAILLDVLHDPVEALKLHQEFKFLTVARFPHDAWEISEAQVLAALEQIKTEAAR